MGMKDEQPSRAHQLWHVFGALKKVIAGQHGIVLNAAIPQEYEGEWMATDRESQVLYDHRSPLLTEVQKLPTQLFPDIASRTIHFCPPNYHPLLLPLLDDIDAWCFDGQQLLYGNDSGWPRRMKVSGTTFFHDLDVMGNRERALLWRVIRLQQATWSGSGDPHEVEMITAATAEGPVEFQKFTYDKRSTDLEPIPFRLLQYLWPRKLVRIEHAKKAVWEEGSDVSLGAVKQAVGRIRDAFEECEAPHDIHIRGEYLLLEFPPS